MNKRLKERKYKRNYEAVFNLLKIPLILFYFSLNERIFVSDDLMVSPLGPAVAHILSFDKRKIIKSGILEIKNELLFTPFPILILVFYKRILFS